MTPELQIVLIAVVTAVAAALPGTYLVLRRTALVSDAISHAILPGIVVAFFLTHDLNSPLLLVAAAATGVLTVFLIEALFRSRLVPEDASIGLVFPALFSIGVILISRYAGDVHLDTDSVLLGELALAPFDQMVIGGVEMGPRALWTMGVILVLNLVDDRPRLERAQAGNRRSRSRRVARIFACCHPLLADGDGLDHCCRCF